MIVSEGIHVFGAQRHLVGTLAHPAQMPTSRVAVIAFNAGVIPRVGPHRLWVRASRALASAGVPSLRFDLAGLGDSALPRTSASFEERGISDVRAAMDFLEDEIGIDRFALVGICSGAAFSFAVADRDPRVIGCFVVDPYMYPTWRTHAVRLSTRVRMLGLSGLMRKLLVRPAGSGSGPDGSSDVGQVQIGLPTPPRDQFGALLRRLVDRRVTVNLLYTGSALYRYNYAAQFADVFTRYGVVPAVECEFVPEIDHMVTEVRAQRLLIGRLLAWTGRLPQDVVAVRAEASTEQG